MSSGSTKDRLKNIESLVLALRSEVSSISLTVTEVRDLAREARDEAVRARMEVLELQSMVERFYKDLVQRLMALSNRIETLFAGLNRKLDEYYREIVGLQRMVSRQLNDHELRLDENSSLIRAGIEDAIINVREQAHAIDEVVAEARSIVLELDDISMQIQEYQGMVAGLRGE